MAKKKSLNLKLILTAVSLLLAVVTLVLLVAPGISAKSEYGDKSYSLASVAFGNKEQGLAFSFLVFLPYVLLIAGIILNVISLLNKGGKLLPVIATACYVAGAVLFFLVMQTYVVYVSDALEGAFKENAIKIARAVIDETCTLGLGAIFSGILSAISGGLSLVTAFVKK